MIFFLVDFESSVLLASGLLIIHRPKDLSKGRKLLEVTLSTTEVLVSLSLQLLPGRPSSISLKYIFFSRRGKVHKEKNVSWFTLVELSGRCSVSRGDRKSVLIGFLGHSLVSERESLPEPGACCLGI